MKPRIVAAAVLTQPGRHGGATYELTGPRAVTFAEAVELIAQASGLSLAYRQVSSAEYTAMLLEQGLDEDAAAAIAAMYDVLARGLLADATEDVATVLVRAPRTFEDYVVRAASAGAWLR